VRGGGGGDGVDFTPNQREWEEEQVRLDREWYEDEEGVVSLLSSSVFLREVGRKLTFVLFLFSNRLETRITTLSLSTRIWDELRRRKWSRRLR